MTSTRAPSLPSRRALLLSGAVLGLAGCDLGRGSLPWSSPAPRATVTLSPLTTAADLVPDEPVFRGEWAVSPTSQRPLALLVRREKALEADLRAATIDAPDGVEVPVDAAATGLLVDGHSARVRVYSRTIEGSRHHGTMLTSADLVAWESVDLGTVIDRALAATGGGLVASAAHEGTVQVWEIAEDGSVTALAPLDLPADEHWDVECLARSEQRLALVVTRTTAAENSVPALITSTDGGASWSTPRPLPSDGTHASVREVLVQDGTFVLLGLHEAGVEWDEHVTHRRPIAWSLADGGEVVTEEIPLPLWGIEDYVQSEGRGDLEPGTPLDFLDLQLGLPVLTAEGTEISAPVYYGDDCRRLRRTADGTWTAGEVGPYALHALFGAVIDDTGLVYRVHNRLLARAAGSSRAVEGLVYSRPRDLTVARGADGSGLTGMLSWTLGYMLRSREWIRWAQESDRYALGVEGDRIVRRLEPVFGPENPDSASIHRLEGGLTLFTGMLPEHDRVAEPGFAALISTDGATWEPTTGLPRPENSVVVGTATTVGGSHYLPLAEWVPADDGGDSVLTPSLYSSADGITWDAVPPPVLGTGEAHAARGGRITWLTSVDDVLIGLGFVADGQGEHRPASFVQDGEEWDVVVLPEAPLGSALHGSSAGGDGEIVHGTLGPRRARWRLTAEGTLEETYLSDDLSAHGPVLDLGDGARLAAGWIDRPAPADDAEPEGEIGIGACLWASRDHGETWNATLLPGQEGRFPAVTLLREGEAVLVLVDDPDVPHGYRILDARVDVLGTEET